MRTMTEIERALDEIDRLGRERDAALADAKMWNFNMEVAIKDEKRARAEAEALRAAGAKFLEHLRDPEGMSHPCWVLIEGAGPRYDGPTCCSEFLEFSNALKARLSPPAPKPHPWSAAGLALRDKPAPETAHFHGDDESLRPHRPGKDCAECKPAPAPVHPRGTCPSKWSVVQRDGKITITARDHCGDCPDYLPAHDPPPGEVR